MTKRQAIEALDNSMRDIMGRPGLPFGGKTVVFGGDFRQVLSCCLSTEFLPLGIHVPPKACSKHEGTE